MTDEKDLWQEVHFAHGGAHYNVFRLANPGYGGMEALRTMFPDAEADDMNFVLFSTSGVHGHYLTIEEIEAGDQDSGDDITFLIIHPRMVTTRYGNCIPQTPEDFAFLKKLRASSWKVMTSIGSGRAAAAQQDGGQKE